MSNPEFMNTNNNEVSMEATDNCVGKGEDCIVGTQQNANFVKNTMENSSVSLTLKEKCSQKPLIEIGKDISNANENYSNVLSNGELLSNRLNENSPIDIQRKDKCSLCHHGCQKQDDLTSSIAGENRSDNKNDFNNISLLNDKCLSSTSSQIDGKSLDRCSDMNLEVKLDKNQTLIPKFNIVPNPNEFNLVGKSNLPLQNPDFLGFNQATDKILAFSDSSIVISNSNAIPQSDSIVSSNYSLSQLQEYISDDDEDSVIEEVPAAPLQYREGNQQMEDSEDDSDSSTSSSTSIYMSSSDSESQDEYENFSAKPICKPIKAKGEMDLNDLPPIEDLTINVPEEECVPVGKIYQIVDQLVIIQANKDTPAYDLDTVMFTQDGKPLGKVFDVMGPVTEPYYCIRFNSKDHIKEKNITLNQTVYAAPKTQYSKFVFLAQLMQLKGSDASWENDQEPPEIYLDYSDDEQERRAKKTFFRNKKAVYKTDSDPDEPARKRHAAYEKRMNARNLRISAVKSNQNHNKSRPENGNVLRQPNLPTMIGVSPPPMRPLTSGHHMFGRPPLFDTRVPPPNSPFPNHGVPQFHQPEFSVYPQIFAGPSTASRAPGTLPFSRSSASSGGSSFSQPSISPLPPPFPRPSMSPLPPPFPRPSMSPLPPPFPRPSASPGPPPFPRPYASAGPSSSSGRHPLTPPSFCRLPGRQALNSTSPSWNSSFHRSDSPWSSPFPHPTPRNTPPPLRNAPPPFGSFPFSLDFHSSFSNGPSPPGGSRFNILPSWPAQPRTNSPRFNFNPSVPPPSPSFFNN